MPDWLRRALRFVPAAALAALVFPALTHPAGHLDLSLHNFRLLAGLGGAIVAWRTRNVLLTILVGMVLLWILGGGFWYVIQIDILLYSGYVTLRGSVFRDRRVSIDDM